MQGLSNRASSANAPAGAVTWEGDLTPPVQSYASTGSTLANASTQPSASSTAWTRAPVVDRHNRMDGMVFAYGYGKEEAALPQTYPGGNDGLVRNSAYQTLKNHLYNFVTNRALYQAGYPRNLGLTFRVPQIRTQVTGGPHPSRMAQAPQWTKVQTVPRYSTVPQSYATRGSKS